MSENTNNESIIPAKLEDGESVISPEYVETNKEVIEKIVAQNEESVNNEDVEESKEEDSNTTAKLIKEKPALGPVGNGAMGSTTVKEVPKQKAATKTEKAVEKVAVHSTRNVTWSGVGKVYRGYNIVTQEQADKWLTRDHIRMATPEEVAKEFGL